MHERIFTLDVKIDGSLKVKRRTLVITNYEASSNSKEKIKGNGQAPFHVVTIREANDMEDETESTKVLETSKNAEGFQHGVAKG